MTSSSGTPRRSPSYLTLVGDVQELEPGTMRPFPISLRETWETKPTRRTPPCSTVVHPTWFVEVG